MSKTESKSLQALTQDFFLRHLAIERNVSANTVASYRDGIKLFLRHSADLEGCSPDQLDHRVLDPVRVRAFLGWLEQSRGSSPRTRNQRLAALKSFARYVANVAPEHLERCRLVREIPPARYEQPPIRYLTEDEVVRFIAAIDLATPSGRRDRALLLLLYNTGARVQEVVDLDVDDVEAQPVPFVRILGKGRKPRTTPLWSRTVTAIKHMLADRGLLEPTDTLFVSDRGHRLSRSGVTYILRRAQQRASIAPKHAASIGPHVLRHTTAMHLLQSGVDITTIAAWLGHANLTTTHAYVEIDLRMKHAAIASASLPKGLGHAAYPAPEIVDWLDSLASGPRYVQRMGSHRRTRPRGHPYGRAHSA